MTVTVFPICLVTQFALAVKYIGQPRVIIYINFVELSPRCYMPSFKIVELLVLEKKIFKDFYHICMTIYILLFIFQRRLHMKFGFDWLSGFRGEDV